MSRRFLTRRPNPHRTSAQHRCMRLSMHGWTAAPHRTAPCAKAPAPRGYRHFGIAADVVWRSVPDGIGRRVAIHTGMLYERGEGVPKDFQLASRWYQAAAAQGYDGSSPPSPPLLPPPASPSPSPLPAQQMRRTCRPLRPVGVGNVRLPTAAGTLSDASASHGDGLDHFSSSTRSISAASSVGASL